MDLTDDISLGEARRRLRLAVAKGETCPCCRQHAQIYWRSINAGMAVSAVRLLREYRRAPGTYVHLPRVIGRRSAEEAKLRYWNLIEEDPTRRPDGGHAGFWRLTKLGIAWAEGKVKVKRFVRIYDGRRLGQPTDVSCKGKAKAPVGILDALKNRFSYEELLSGA